MRASTPWWYLTVLLYGSLLVALCVWQLTKPSGPNAVVWALQLLPLGLFLPAVMRGWPRGLIGLCFVLLLYFIRAVEGVMASNRAWIDWTLLCLSVTLFVSAMLASRELQRSAHPAPSG